MCNTYVFLREVQWRDPDIGVDHLTISEQRSIRWRFGEGLDNHLGFRDPVKEPCKYLCDRPRGAEALPESTRYRVGTLDGRVLSKEYIQGDQIAQCGESAWIVRRSRDESGLG